MGPGYIPDAGTSLEKAIRLAVRSFDEKERKHRAIVVFSDGEDHEGRIDPALEETQKAGTLRQSNDFCSTCDGKHIHDCIETFLLVIG